MANANSISYKACLKLNYGSVEVRRFGVNQDHAGDFNFLAQKIKGIFPSLASEEFSVKYLDDDHEKIAVSSDEELSIALETNSSKDPYRLEVNIVKPVAEHGLQTAISGTKAGEGEVHVGIICDGCEGVVRGFRYKCIDCVDYDLCAGCERNGLHPLHNMLRFPAPSVWLSRCPYVFSRPCHAGQDKAGAEAGNHDELSRCPYVHKRSKQFEAPKPPMMRKCGRFSRPCHAGHDKAGAEVGNQDEWQLNFTNGYRCSMGSEEKKVENGGPAPAEFLKNIGDGVRAMLDVLGIDVQIDLIPPNPEASEEPTAPAPFESSPPRSPQEQAKEKTEEKKKETREPTPEKPAAFDSEIPMNIGMPFGFENMSGVIAPELLGWTLVNANKERKDKEAEKVAATAPSSSSSDVEMTAKAEVSPKIQMQDPVEMKVLVGLQRMLDMGFDNEGNWLHQLLRTKNGDVSAVIEHLSRKI